MQNKVDILLGQLFPELALPSDLAKTPLSGIATDSRLVQPGDLFIALQGTRADGRKYISSALESGARAIAVEVSPDNAAGSVDWLDGVPVVAVTDLARQVSQLADSFFQSPSREMSVVGVTGTNGKSTCVSLIAQLHQLAGYQAGSIGTLGACLNDQCLSDFGMTTPDAVLCQKLLGQLRNQGAQVVAMEVSSHGLDQGRVAAVSFKAAVFTNLSHDHLDYHGSLEQYAAAKQKLFEVGPLQTAIINLDDPYSQQMVRAAKRNATVLTYSLLHFAADIFATDMHYSTQGVEFRLVTPWGEAWILSPLLGEFNVYNLIAAIAASVSVGVDFERLLEVIPKLHSVPGRMQKVAVPADVIAVVDYAHTPDALAYAIAATRVHTSGCLWVVFGCGGDRDRSKRPAMAKVAERFADVVVVTSDNPRGENPSDILTEICSGFRHKEPVVIPEREHAIRFAVANAASGDVILIAGKGHENYQIIGGQSLPFDDVLVASSALTARSTNGPEVRV